MIALTKETIEKAASWWAGKLIDNQPHSNGDLGFSSVVECFLADAARQDVTLDQLNIFKKILEKLIGEAAKENILGISIECDYRPCKMLEVAAKEAGISTANFPFKTMMFLSEKEGVVVRDGYGAPFTRI
jgi:hypothetical protein